VIVNGVGKDVRFATVVRSDAVCAGRTAANGKVTLPDRFSPGTHRIGPGVTLLLHNLHEPDNEVHSAVKTMPKRNGDAGDAEVVLEEPALVPQTERSHVRLVAGNPPMLRLEINLYSWERGDSEIEVVLPHGGELSDLLHWALPEQRLVICGNLRARIHEELAEVFNILQASAD
jgi:hypothetical protein